MSPDIQWHFTVITDVEKWFQYVSYCSKEFHMINSLNFHRKTLWDTIKCYSPIAGGEPRKRGLKSLAMKCPAQVIFTLSRWKIQSHNSDPFFLNEKHSLWSVGPLVVVSLDIHDDVLSPREQGTSRCLRILWDPVNPKARPWDFGVESVLGWFVLL